MKVIHNAMHNLYGRHNPINYKPEFNFQESWESTSKDSYLEDKYNMLNTENHLFISLHLTICLIFGLLAWFFSVYRVFGFDDEFCSVVGILVVFQLLDGILKQFLMFSFMEEKNMSRSSLGCKDYLKLHWRGMAIMGYLGMMLSE